VRFETARAYWGQLLAAEALRTVRDGLETARAHARDAEARYKQETIALPDLLAARVRVAELEEEVILAESRLADAEESMSLVLDLDIAARVVPRDSLRRLDAAYVADTLVVRALRERPDLRAVEYRADAARKGAVAARGPFWPRLDAYFSAELNSEKFLDHDGDSWTTGAMLTWDLFAGGRSHGGSREAQAQAAAATAMASFEKKRAEREVRQAFREVQAAGKRTEVAEAALEQATERLRITTLQYREGAATTTDLLDAQAGETQARLRRVQSLHDLNVGVARLTFVVGGRLN
jgi:outer membrane protein TolC